MKILVLNWRDIKNPSSGGAEVLTHELAKRWVKMGHEVTQFSSHFAKSLREESIDGVKIIRFGHPDARYLFFSVHFLAFWNYMKKYRGKVDVVVDEIHGLPFFTPWYVKERKVALICEVAKELWQKLYGPLFGTTGRLIELYYLHFIYKLSFLTISDSTKKDLLKEGISEKLITVLPMGITPSKKDQKYKKEKTPTLIYVGRLSKSKGIEDTMITFSMFLKDYPSSNLWIVGRGENDYSTHLKSMAKKLKINKNTIFFGFVDEEKKFELLRKAYILLSASSKEGFGLTIPEAGSVGTPCVVYRSPGLSDIVVHNKSGLICMNNSPEYLYENVKKIIEDKKLYARLVSGARNESKKYNWDNTAQIALQVLNYKK